MCCWLDYERITDNEDSFESDGDVSHGHLNLVLDPGPFWRIWVDLLVSAQESVPLVHSFFDEVLVYLHLIYFYLSLSIY